MSGNTSMLDGMAILQEAWEHFKLKWQSWVVISLVHFACVLVAAFTCIGWILVGPLTIGMYMAAFQQLRGQEPEVADLWSGFQWFGPSFLAMLLTSLAVFCGLLLCIIPGLVLAIWWIFTLPLIATHNLGAIEAMKMSKDRVSKCFWDVVILLLIAAGVNFVAGLIPFGGVVIGTPLMTLMIAIAHRDLYGLDGAAPPLRPAPAPAFPVGPAPAGNRACPKCGAANFATAQFCTTCGGAMA
jgi:hypothetical protein